MAVMVRSASAANIAEQIKDGMFRNSSHAASGIDRDAFNESRDHLNPLINTEAIHNENTLYLLVHEVKENICSGKY
jgi:hypothetical protein